MADPGKSGRDLEACAAPIRTGRRGAPSSGRRGGPTSCPPRTPTCAAAPLLAYGANASPEALARKLARAARRGRCRSCAASWATSTSSTPPTSLPTARCPRPSGRAGARPSPVFVAYPTEEQEEAIGHGARLRAGGAGGIVRPAGGAIRDAFGSTPRLPHDRRRRGRPGGDTRPAGELGGAGRSSPRVAGARFASRPEPGLAPPVRRCGEERREIRSDQPGLEGGIESPTWGIEGRSDGAKRRRATGRGGRRRRAGSPGRERPTSAGPAESSAPVSACSAGLKGKGAATTSTTSKTPVPTAPEGISERKAIGRVTMKASRETARTSRAAAPSVRRPPPSAPPPKTIAGSQSADAAPVGGRRRSAARRASAESPPGRPRYRAGPSR